MKETIGFIGLGNMGLAMAANLLKAGFGLRVYNRTAEKAHALLEQGARLARSPAEAAEPGSIVVTMVSDDRALEELTLGTQGLLSRLAGGVHLSMSTIARTRHVGWRNFIVNRARVMSHRLFSASPRWQSRRNCGSQPQATPRHARESSRSRRRSVNVCSNSETILAPPT
jgi:hypothetical protein